MAAMRRVLVAAVLAGGCLLVAVAQDAAAPAGGPTPAPPPPAAPATGNPETNFYVSIMLLGSVAFIMSLFYLLHWHDADIRTYAWNVVSASICTFTGVLIGMAWSGCFNAFVVGPPAVAGPMKTILCDAWAAVGWYVVLQTVLAYVSGAVGDSHMDRVTTVLNLKCFAVLLGVTTGASNLNLWGLVQQQVPHTVPHLLSVAILCALCLYVLFKIGDFVRDMVSKGDDGSTDDYEKLWDKFAEETEDGALCMTVSHLIVQVTRFHITGKMPLPGGQVPPGATPTVDHAWALFFCGIGYAMLIPILDVLFPSSMPRRKGWTKKTAANSMSFCWLYAITWGIQGGSLDVKGPPGAMLQALFVTLFGFTIIFILDKITDMSCTGEATDREVKAFIAPLSLLIGFAWKQAFVGAITTITGQVKAAAPPVETLVMAVTLAVVVVPAWRLYILPVVMQEEVKKMERREAELHSKGKPSTSKVTPLLGDKSSNGKQAAALPAADTLATAGLSSEELARRNTQLARRNAELESSIRDIRGELSELKQLAALLS